MKYVWQDRYVISVSTQSKNQSIVWLQCYKCMDKMQTLSVTGFAQTIWSLRITRSFCHIKLKILIHHVCKPLRAYFAFPTRTWFSKLECFHMDETAQSIPVLFITLISRPLSSQLDTPKHACEGEIWGFVSSNLSYTLPLSLRRSVWYHYLSNHVITAPDGMCRVKQCNIIPSAYTSTFV